MAGKASGGQTLTPNPNVLAVGGNGGDVWGVNGGGAIAIGGGATDQTGYVKPIAATPSDCETPANFIPFPTSRQFTVLGQQNNASLSGQVLDSQLGGGTTNAG